MMEPFKNLIHPGLVQRMAGHLQRAWPAFDAQAFVKQASTGLDALEMKARAMQLADALGATLPAEFAHAAQVLEAALAPPWPGDRLGSDDPCRDGLEGWALWPVGEFVARHGLAQPERGLQALHAITQRFSAEFAIRPFIAAHPDTVFPILQRWTADSSAHVRRLVSEGSRPRLPWGLQLKALVADPAPTAPLLLSLQDDTSDYVRRSVANHLNDIAKDHPARVVAWVQQHLNDAPAERRALLRHASRTLVKQGHAGMLKAWGLGQALKGELTLVLSPARITLGQSLQMAVLITSSARRTQTLVIDYAVHHVKADGSLSPKVFKGWNLVLAPGETRALRKAHPVRPITTRRYHAGGHVLDLRVNGQVLAEAAFDLQLG
ncbi:MAG: DNA alkylation repair protein [Rubrivivax sp.]|nr:DNA alkylation repair protein [Rubrivivax sp.]